MISLLADEELFSNSWKWKLFQSFFYGNLVFLSSKELIFSNHCSIRTNSIFSSVHCEINTTINLLFPSIFSLSNRNLPLSEQAIYDLRNTLRLSDDTIDFDDEVYDEDDEIGTDYRSVPSFESTTTFKIQSNLLKSSSFRCTVNSIYLLLPLVLSQTNRWAWNWCAVWQQKKIHIHQLYQTVTSWFQTSVKTLPNKLKIRLIFDSIEHIVKRSLPLKWIIWFHHVCLCRNILLRFVLKFSNKWD